MNRINKKKPDIIIVDDHLIFRHGLKAIINYEDIGSIIGEASNGEEFLKILAYLKPDLVLMDIDMPLMNGFEATQKALLIMPDLKIIGFTVFSETEYYDKMLKIGARGFILKSSGFNELEKAIKTVMNGDIYFANKNKDDINSEACKNEILAGTEIEKNKNSNKRKLLFFPWIVNRKNCIPI